MKLKRLGAALIILTSFLLVLCVSASQGKRAESKPVVLSVQLEHGRTVYKLDGKTVEDRRDNSLLNSLMHLATDRGTNVVIFLIIDERVPFTEVGKLETALDKIDIPNRRLFVADFTDGTMNEIHLDQKAEPIPAD